MMSSYSQENAEGEKPPERGNQPAGDGQPERTGAPRVQSSQKTELVPDDAEAYEEQHTGIRISFCPKEEEAYECLKKVVRTLERGRKSTMRTASFTLFAVAFAAAGVHSGEWWFYAFAAACVAAAAYTAASPNRTYRRLAREYSGGGTIRIRVYPDRIQIARNGKAREIPLNGTSECAQIGDALALFVPQKGPRSAGEIYRPVLILPLRCVDPGALPEVQAMILAGTRPFPRREL